MNNSLRAMKKEFRAILCSESVKMRFDNKVKYILERFLKQYSTVRQIYKEIRLCKDESFAYDLPKLYEPHYVICKDNGKGLPWDEYEDIDFPTFIIEGISDILYQDLLRGNIISGEKAVADIFNQILLREEFLGWSLIQKYAEHMSGKQKFTGRDISINTIVEMLHRTGVFKERIPEVFMSEENAEELITSVDGDSNPKCIISSLKKDIVDVNVHFVNGMDFVPRDKIFTFVKNRESDPFGVMAVKQALEIRDNPLSLLELKYGIIAQEEVGFAVLKGNKLFEVTLVA